MNTLTTPRESARRAGVSPALAVAVVYVSAQLMAGIDMNIVNVVLPTLSRDFAAPLSSVQWTVVSYLLALAVFIPASGWLGDRLGLKRTFLAALTLFVVASALCGVVDSLSELIAARALQGIGGAMMVPTGTAMLYRAYPAEQRARIARTLIVPVLIGPGAAPILGGVLTQTLSWRWVFLVNVPVGVLTLAFAWRALPASPGSRTGRLDLAGLVMSGLGLSGLLYGISEGPDLGWGSVPIVLSITAGLGLLILFVRRCGRRTDPLLKIGLLRDRLFRSTQIVFVLSTGPFLGSLYLTPIFLQEVVHQSPLGSGSTTFLEAVGVGLGAQTLARIYPRVGPRVLAAIGASVICLYLGLFLLVDPDTNLWLVRGLMLLGGLGNSAAFLAVQTAMFATIRRRDLSHASAIYTTQRQSTIAVNVAVLTTILAAAGGTGTGAFHLAYLVAAAMALGGVACAVGLIRTADARATMSGTAGPHLVEADQPALG